MALVDAQIVATMKRRLRSRLVEFSLTPYRPLTPDEVAAIGLAAEAYAAFLEVKPSVIWETG